MTKAGDPGVPAAHHLRDPGDPAAHHLRDPGGPAAHHLRDPGVPPAHHLRTTDTSWGAATLGDHLIRTVKALHGVRQQAPRPHPEVEPAAYPILFGLVAKPRRVTELAEIMYVDVSTVSRQVSGLADLGLVEKLPDPADGRASVISLTDSGADVLADLRRARDAWLAEVVVDWTEAEVADFAAHLKRFADRLEEHRAGLLRGDAALPHPR